VSGEGLKALSRLLSLTALDLYAARVDDAGAARLGGLTNLRVRPPASPR
jgi:hypothetical protein